MKKSILDTSNNLLQFEILQDEKEILALVDVDNTYTSSVLMSPEVNNEAFPIGEEMEFSIPLRTEQIEPKKIETADKPGKRRNDRGGRRRQRPSRPQNEQSTTQYVPKTT